MTTHRYLLDTNIISDLVRHPGGVVAARVACVKEDEVCTSILVVSELRYGATKKSSARLIAQLETVLSALDVLPFDSPADQHYAVLRVSLEKLGTPIGSNDMLIAAHALSLDLILVTNNTREFARVSGLRIENWLAP